MLSILIVNWNTRDLLRACLRSLEQTCREIETEIIVVDNDSRDDSAQMVADEFPDVQLIANACNESFARGNNQAYKVARGEWVWLLNPDTEVLEDAARQLIDWLQSHPRCGAVASSLIDARDGKPQRSCRAFPTPAALWCEASGLVRRFPRSRRFGFYRMGWWSYQTTRRVEQPMASSFLLRREAIENSGGLFDEDFPIFFNDVDLCWRLHEANWQIWYLPTSHVRHWGGASTSQVRPAMLAASHAGLKHFYRKHFRARLSPLLYAATLALIDVSGRARVWRAKRRRRTKHLP